MGRLPRQPNAHRGAALSLTRLRAAFRAAFAGIAAVWATSGNFRLEVGVGVLALVLGLMLQNGRCADPYPVRAGAVFGDCSTVRSRPPSISPHRSCTRSPNTPRTPLLGQCWWRR